MSFEDIAKELGMSEHQARKIVENAIIKIKKHLKTRPDKREALRSFLNG